MCSINQSNGKKFLSWAYVEAANFFIRYSNSGKQFFQRELAQKNRAVAVKATAKKLAKASFSIMRDQREFDAKLLFR